MNEQCEHVWPADLDADAVCEVCQLPYREWQEES